MILRNSILLFLLPGLLGACIDSKRKNGQYINAEFNPGNRYFYDSQGRPTRTEYYRLDEYYDSEKIVTVYDFQYN